TPLASRRIEDGNGVSRPPGKGEREAIVRSLEKGASLVEQGDGLPVLALGNLNQCIFQHDLRLHGLQRQRIAECGLGRLEAAGGKVAIAEEGAKFGTLRR